MTGDNLSARVLPILFALVLLGSGASAVGIAVYGFFIADAPDYQNYQTALERCDERAWNESMEEECLNMTYAEHQRLSTQSFLAYPLTARAAAVWAIVGGVTGTLGMGILLDQLGFLPQGEGKTGGGADVR